MYARTVCMYVWLVSGRPVGMSHDQVIFHYSVGYLFIRFPWIWVDISYKLSFLCMPFSACIVCMVCHMSLA